jgi:CRP-like cAMP-binding protein
MKDSRLSSTRGVAGAEPGASVTNLLLAALPGRESLTPFLERAALEPDETIYQVGDSITRCVFPLRGIVSVVKETPRGGMEVGTAGVEGMAGIPALLGVPISMARVFAQTPLVADYVSVELMGNLMAASPAARDLLLRYVHAVHEEACQSIFCARFHTLEERCARWLLLAHDRLGSDTMPLKQRFLSNMLGVHRPAVSVAASALQEAGLIHYSRGHVAIRDREGLERASCECYAAARETFRRARLPWGAGATTGSDTLTS